jgi:hypothetical protein
MSTMSPSLLASLIASLANPDHEWSVASAVTHTTPSMPGLTLNTGGVTPQTVTGPASDALVDKTFQLQSDPLGLIVVVMAHLRNAVFDGMTVYYRGSGFETDSEDLYDAIVAMADPEIVTIQSEFEAMIRKKFEAASGSASASLVCTATKI